MFFKRNNSVWVKVLVFYIITSFINDNLLLLFNDRKYDRLTYVILCVYTIIEYSIFASVLYLIIERKIFRLIIIVLTICFFAFAATIFFISTKNNFDSLPASVESICIITYCIFYLFDQLNKPQIIFIYQHQNFWFVTGFIIYLSATLFLFIEASDLSKEVRDGFWKILLFANIVKNILFAIAFSRKETPDVQNALENPFDDKLFESTYKT